MDLLCCLFDYRMRNEPAVACPNPRNPKYSANLSNGPESAPQSAIRFSMPNGISIRNFKGAKTYFVTRKGQRLKGDYRDVEEADLINIANEIERCREEFTDFLKSTFPEYERFRKP